MKSLLFFPVLFLSCALSGQIIQVDSTQINAASPDGFAEVSNIFPAKYQLRQKLVLERYRLHAWFVETDGGVPLTKPPYRALQVQTYSEYDTKIYTRDGFQKMAKGFIKQFETTDSRELGLDEMREKLVRLSDSIQINGLTALGVISQGDEHVAIATLSSFKNGEQLDRSLSVSTMCLVKGKVLFLYVTCRAPAKDELDWARNFVINWVKFLKQNNPS